MVNLTKNPILPSSLNRALAEMADDERHRHASEERRRRCDEAAKRYRAALNRASLTKP